MKFALVMALVIAGARGSASAQQTGYVQTNLVGNVAGVGNHTDAQLSNPWGIAFIPGNAFWIANNNGGTSTLYDAAGNKQPGTITIPTAANAPCAVGCPTGVVANTSTAFGGAAFIFDTEDGIIASWTGAPAAIVSRDNSARGAVYKGLAILTNNNGTFLLAANFGTATVEAFDRNFQPAILGGTFTDPNLPVGYAPHGIHVLAGGIFVTYAEQDVAKHDPVIGAGLGFIDEFDTTGNFVKRFATGGNLNAPWAAVVAPANFGDFSNDLLVSNFGDGTITAFDNQGNEVGQVTDAGGNKITIPGLWELVFGSGGTGDPNTLYLTAGGADQTTGLFASLVPATAVGNGDFSLHLSAAAATVPAGGSTTVQIDSGSVAGFNAAVNLSCSGLPTGVTCNFNPAAITPGSNTASSTLTLAVSTTYHPPYMVHMYGVTGFVFAGIGLFLVPRRKRLTRQLMTLTGLMMLAVVGLVACGGSSSSNRPGSGAQTITITGQAGALTHSVPLTLTVR